MQAKNVEFKSWIQEQMKKNLAPCFKGNGFKKGRTNCYIRERNHIVQFICFIIKQEKVQVWGGSSPIYLPLEGIAYKGMLVSEHAWLSTSGVRVPSPEHLLTPEAEEKWGEVERIIKDSVLMQFDQIENLDDLMSVTNFAIPDKEMWKGIQLYTQGVYDCLLETFDIGVEKLFMAQECKRGYLEFLKNIGSTYGKKGDQLSVIYNYVDLFCNKNNRNEYTEESFLEVYGQVCNDSRKWYKIQ